MKLAICLVSAACVAGLSVPAFAAGMATQATLLDRASIVLAKVPAAKSGSTDWAAYCRAIRNRMRRQACQQEHGIPQSK